MRNLKACPHCGQIGLWRLQYDRGWEIECSQCSCIVSIPDNEIPTGLNPRQYQVAEIPSPTDVVSIFPIPFGHYRPSIRRDSTEE